MNVAKYCHLHYGLQAGVWKVDPTKKEGMRVKDFLKLAIPDGIPNRNQIIDAEREHATFYHPGEPLSLFENIARAHFDENFMSLEPPATPVYEPETLVLDSKRTDVDDLMQDYQKKVFSDVKPHLISKNLDKIREAIITKVSWDEISTVVESIKTTILQEIQTSLFIAEEADDQKFITSSLEHFSFHVDYEKLKNIYSREGFIKFLLEVRLKKSAELKMNMEKYDLKKEFEERIQSKNRFLLDRKKQQKWALDANLRKKNKYLQELHIYTKTMEERCQVMLEKAVYQHRVFTNYCQRLS